jgi:hypothetical protein
MVRLPEEFIATKFSGYFFNTKENVLYSVKIRGVLRPLKKTSPNYFNKLREPAFYISVDGKRRAYVISKLLKLAEKAKENPVDEIFPVYKESVK